MYSTIIFDLDGTLLNTLEDLKDAVNYVQRKYCYEEDSIDTVRMNVGNGIRNLVIRSIPGGENNLIFEEAFIDFQKYYKEHCMEKTKAYEGISQLLKELKQRNIKMAIVSNKAHSAVVELNSVYFKDYINVAVGEDEAGGIKRKPAPDEVNLALEKLGADKAGALYVGDSDVDKATADNSGLDCVLCSWGFRKRELLETLGAKTIIDSPNELLDFI
jgi:phosphoglycolate phosphatase